jgi:NADH-quinone oxidoreductase subunit F
MTGAQEKPLTRNIRPDAPPLDFAGYVKAGGYQALEQALAMSPGDVTELVKKSNLRGRGGAGFPTGLKWTFVPMGKEVGTKYLVANADEMEPGTFKDRLLMEGDPHQLIEGMLVAAHAIQADVAYIFIRGEYKLAIARLTEAIEEAYAHGLLGQSRKLAGKPVEMYLHTSVGRYMCGDETGLLNALEGGRANPRAKPPFPQVAGLFGRPTVVQNVETLCNLPHIVRNGWEWFRGLSHTADGGTKLYGASGRVKRPGLWELPMGTTAREILEEHAGGMREGYRFRAVIPGGASTEFLLEQHLDVRLDFNEPPKAGSRLGTGTMIVVDDKTCPVGLLLNLEHFFAQESCGFCTPCWSGLTWTEQTLRAMEDGSGEPGDLEVLENQVRQCAPGNTYCALAPGAMEPLQSALVYFREDFERHITLHRCPWT